MRHLMFAAALTGFFWLGGAACLADTRCDCSTIVGGCTATVEVDDRIVRVESSSPSCSQVTWLSDGHPRTTVVLDGADLQPNLGSVPASVAVASCRVCEDRLRGQVAAEAPQSEPRPFVPRPRRTVPAEYPPSAMARGIEGRVVLRLDVDPSGAVVRTTVVSSPFPALSDAAVHAAMAYEFAPSDTGGSVQAPFSFFLAE
jgi:TonB family protein